MLKWLLSASIRQAHSESWAVCEHPHIYTDYLVEADLNSWENICEKPATVCQNLKLFLKPSQQTAEIYIRS